MVDVILSLIEIEQQLRILHWQTKSYARHQAFGKLYSDLGDLIDQFAEVCMGKHGRFAVDHQHQINLININEMSAEDFVDGACKFLISLNTKLDQRSDSDLLNIRDEMLGNLNQLKYLLTLK